MTSKLETQSKRMLNNRYSLLADNLGGEIIERHNGAVCLVRTLFPWDFQFGNKRLSESRINLPVRMSDFMARESNEKIPIDNLLFFDTETTGLGGSEAVAFLVGCASVVEKGIEIRQYMLPDYGDEAALLEMLLDEFDDKKTLVSFNGAAFDCNILRDRMIVNRVSSTLPHAGNIDLLHTVRRLFRRSWKDCRLQTAEARLFSYYRVGDIPGSEIPELFFEWQHSDNLDGLPEVLLHNRIDIISMYFLMNHISGLFAEEGSNLVNSAERYSLARIYGNRKQFRQAASLLSEYSDKNNMGASEEIVLYHAMTLKKSGDWSAAVPLWEGLSESFSGEAFLANIQLAMYFEHQSNEQEKALQWAERAALCCPDSSVPRRQLDKRIARLRSKQKLSAAK